MKRTFRPPKPSGPRCLGGSLEARLAQPPTPTCWEPTAPCSVPLPPEVWELPWPPHRAPGGPVTVRRAVWRAGIHSATHACWGRRHARRSCISSPLGLAEAAGRTAGALCPLDPHSRPHEPPQGLHQAEAFACQGMQCQGRQTSRPRFLSLHAPPTGDIPTSLACHTCLADGKGQRGREGAPGCRGVREASWKERAGRPRASPASTQPLQGQTLLESSPLSLPYSRRPLPHPLVQSWGALLLLTEEPGAAELLGLF